MKPEDWKSLLEEMIERLVECEEMNIPETTKRYNYYQLNQLQSLYERDFGKRYDYTYVSQNKEIVKDLNDTASIT